MDPYDTYDPRLSLGSLVGHKDAVWSLAAIPIDNEERRELTNSNEDEVDLVKLIDSSNDKVQLICSASADNTIKVWNLEKQICMKSIALDENLLGKPTCLIALPLNATLDSASSLDTATIKEKQSTNNSSLSQYIACSFSKGSIQIYDLNSSTYSQPVLSFGSSVLSSEQPRINSIIVHPTLTVIVSAHEDKYLRFWDYTTGNNYGFYS